MTEKPTCPHIVSSDEGTQYCGLGLDYARELTALACESVERDKTLAKLEAEVIASRDIVVKAVARAEELERLVRAYQEAFNASDGITESMAAKAKRVALFAAVAEKDGE